MGWPEHYHSRTVSLEEAVSHIRSGNRVVITLGEEPRLLASGLQARAGDIENVVIQCAGPANELGWFDPGIDSSFNVQVQNSYRYTYRPFLDDGRAEYLPSLFTLMFKGIEERGLEDQRPDVFFAVVSPPDQNGFCSFGHSLWNKRTFAASARMVIVEVDPRTIRTFGTNSIHVTDIDYFVVNPDTGPVLYHSIPDPDDAVQEMGRHVSTLIHDGDTIQIGWGRVGMSLPRAGIFDGKKDLGIHSEVMAPGMLPLVEEGIINGSRKTLNRDKAVTSALAGAGREMDLAANNPKVEVRDVDYTNDLRVISAHDNMVAVNGAASVDLTGQINVESAEGSHPINGPGGQQEFVIGALASRGGRSITVLRSTTRDGQSRIVPLLEAGASVTIPRTLADYVVTEYGVAALLGKTTSERARALTNIDHPTFRKQLTDSLKNRSYSPGPSA